MRKATETMARLTLLAAAGGAAYAVWKAKTQGGGKAALPAGQKVVILGAGFAGIHVAQELARLLPPDSDAQITLVDQNDFLLFTPMLTEAAGGQVDTRHIVDSVRRLAPRIGFEQGRVETVDPKARQVTLTVGGSDGIPPSHRTLSADHLVFALGSTTNFHGLPGVPEHSQGIKTIADAAAIRSRVPALLERAAAEPNADVRQALLTLVVAGGGYSGVETMAAVNDLLRDNVRDYPSLSADLIQSILIEPGGRLLPELNEGLAHYARQKLEQRGVCVRLKTEITGAGEGYVEVKGEPRVPAFTLIWAAGIKPSPVVEALPVKRGRHGGIVVDACCAVPDHPGIWALGDCAEIPQPGSQGTYAPTAQNAMREGTQTAKNIVATLRGAPPQPFVYTPVGELALVGKRSGVARLYNFHFSGLLAWAMWRGVYLAKMPGWGKRARILTDWTLDALFGRDSTDLLGVRGDARDA